MRTTKVFVINTNWTPSYEQYSHNQVTVPCIIPTGFLKVKLKVKVTLEKTMKVQRESRV